MPENKTKPTRLSVATFVRAIADAGKRSDAEALIAMITELTSEKPVMWGPSIVGFGTRHYKYDSGREGDSPVVAFSPRQAALVLYGLIGASGSGALLEKLGKYTTGKGCLYVKRLVDIDQAILRSMVREALVGKRRARDC